MKIDIICPVYKDIVSFKRLFASFMMQKSVEICNVCCSLTLSHDKTDNEFRQFFNNNGIKFFEVEKGDFSHSLTREKLVRDFCNSDIVVMISQDIKLQNELVFFNLAKSIVGDVVYSYSRQILKNKSIEKYIREKNYPDHSYIVEKKDLGSSSIMPLFASDACSCINRKTFINLGGYQGIDVQMNEDQLYSKIILEAGYKKAYIADSVIEHAHKYSLKEIYKRYYNIGQFYRKMNWHYKFENSGFKLALYVLKRSILDLNIIALLEFIPNMLARYFGMKKGQR